MASNLEKRRINNLRYNERNREKNRERTRVWRSSQSIEQRRAYRRKQLGIPNPTRARPSLCECCGSPPGKVALAVDHNHRTGVFRGWLCGKCNTSIGMLGDDLAGIQRAAAYLQRNDE